MAYMRRLFVTILILLFSFQVKAECVDDLRILAVHSAPSVDDIYASSIIALEPRSTVPLDAFPSTQAPHADFSDSILSDAPLAHYRVSRDAWCNASATAFPALCHPLFKPPPI